MEKKKMRLLLVEDMPGHVYMVNTLLKTAKDFPHEIVSVERLEEALAQLEGPAFDVALVDLGLPDSSGFDTFARIREKAPELPVIVLTVLEDDAIAARATAEGAFEYLIKGDLDQALLIQSISAALERRRAPKPAAPEPSPSRRAA